MYNIVVQSYNDNSNNLPTTTNAIILFREIAIFYNFLQLFYVVNIFVLIEHFETGIIWILILIILMGRMKNCYY